MEAKAFRGFGLSTVVSIGLVIHYQIDLFLALMLITLEWMLFGKIAWAMFYAHGYGVKKGVTIIAGMPMFLAVMFVVWFGLIGLLFSTAYQDSTLLPVTIANFIKAFVWVATASIIGVLDHWYAYGKETYFYESEYNIRCKCKADGQSRVQTHLTVIRCQEEGIIKRT